MTFRRLVPLALVALLAASCGDNDKKSASATTTASTATSTTTPTSTVSTGPSGTTPIPAVPSTKANRLFLGKRDLYPLLAASLTQYVPDQVQGNSLKVVQVAGVDSFWAGRNRKQRILVKLNLKGGSPVQVQAGQRVDFVGQLARAQDASLLGVKDKTGRLVLENQGVYVIVSARDLKLH
jgi:hypothetical protein